MKKRIIAVFLFCCMLMQSTAAIVSAQDLNQQMPSSAVGLSTAPEDVTDVKRTLIAENQTTTPIESAPTTDEVINFEIQLQMDLSIPRDKLEANLNGFVASLQNKTKPEEPVLVSPTIANDKQIVFKASGLPAGEYELTLSMEHYFQTYTQTFTVEDNTKTTLVLSNSYETARATGTSPGVFAVGDINDDGSIEEKDADILFKQMQQAITSAINQTNDQTVMQNQMDITYDLNQDGDINIADLSYLSYNYKKDVVYSTPMKTILKTAVEVEAAQGEVDPNGGTLDSLMEDAEKPVSITPPNKEEAISPENPIEISMAVKEGVEVKTEALIISSPPQSANAPTAGTIRVDVVNEDGSPETITATLVDESSPINSAKMFSARASEATAIKQPDGSIVIDLGRQVAIKKVTIVVTKTASNTNLTEIAKVEFLNDMASRIPPPEMNTPTDVTAQGKGKEFTVSWSPETNVTGYKLQIRAKNEDGKWITKSGTSDKYADAFVEEFSAGNNQITITGFTPGRKNKVQSLWTYYICVQSTNGEWKSPYSDNAEHYQYPSGPPPAPDAVKINGKYRELAVTWKAMEDTEFYSVFYREKGTTDYKEISNVQTNAKSITGLKDNTQYDVYVKGFNYDEKNQVRGGPPSIQYAGKTISPIPIFPKYDMINSQSKGPGELTDHIVDVKTSAVDLSQYPSYPFDPKFVVDGDYSTFYQATSGQSHGATVTFDQTYDLKECILSYRLDDQHPGYSSMSISVWPDKESSSPQNLENGKDFSIVVVPNAMNTIKIIFTKPMKTEKIKIHHTKAYNWAVTISELNFFRYDSIEEDIYSLYTDDMHIQINPEICTEDYLKELEGRVAAYDEVNKEYRPNRALLQSEIDNARTLLNDKAVQQPVELNYKITTNGTGYVGFSGLSGLQPMGAVAATDSMINVYVGQKGRKIGENVPVKLVFTQYHGESAAWKSTEFSLNQGLNQIKVPLIASLDYERGGSVYITSASAPNVVANPIQVRISGVNAVPTLNLYRPIGQRNTNDEVGMKAQISAYITNLNNHTYHLASNHEKHKEMVEGKNYSKQNCFLDATEISLDNMLISVSGEQVLKGMGVSPQAELTAEQLATATDQLYSSLMAWNGTVEQFYQQKGFNPAVVNGTHGMPSARLNMRYHRMFAGAFMYAGGGHFGIEYASCTVVSSMNDVVADEAGKYISGSYAGWGCAHEIGHNIDQSGLTYSEKTNNLYSQFAMSHDTEDTSRIGNYESVYKTVTSQVPAAIVSGYPASVDYPMYWQLHLAYDTNYLFKDYYTSGNAAADYSNMFSNNFFARFFSYKRQPALAPKAAVNGIGLTISNNFIQDTIRLACAAAQKDLTDFFTAWSVVANADTIKYAAQWEKESRAIQYINDAAHEYTLAGKPQMVSKTVTADLQQGTGSNAKKVTLNITMPDEPSMDAILGYEIIRNGKSVGFIQPDKLEDEDGNVTGYADRTVYVDDIGAQNNRVFDYSIVAYDKYLNKTSVKVCDTIKIRHEGDLSKDKWTISSNAVSSLGSITVYDETELVDGQVYTDVATGLEVTYLYGMDIKYLDQYTGEGLKTVSGAYAAVDDNNATEFKGTGTNGSGVWIQMDLDAKETVVGLRYMAHSKTPPPQYEIWYSNNNGASYNKISSWKSIKNADGSYTMYFNNGNNLKGIQMTNIHFTTNWGGYMISAAELGLVGQSGDNVDIGISSFIDGKEVWDTENTIGILDEDYSLDANNIIPQGSFIVTGQYTGNSAYNVVKLFDQNRNFYDDSEANKVESIISGYQAIFAPPPAIGQNITNTTNGTWIYWLEPLSGENAGKFGLPGANADGSDVIVEIPKKVFAELYRVDNAITLAGERLVSNSFMVDVPSVLPHIKLTHDDGMPTNPSADS